MSANIPNDPQAIQRFFTSRDNNANASTYVGQEQRLWYDPITNAIYVSDGNTAGGIMVGASGSGNGVPGGPTNSVQYNAGGGSFGGTANLTISGNGISVVGNVTTATFFIGDGSQLTNLPVQPGTYSNANVANYLPTDTTIININSNVANTNANVANLTTALSNTNSNVSNLTLIVANNTSNITTLQGLVYSNANVANYLPVYSGNISGGNIGVSGAIDAVGDITSFSNIVVSPGGYFQGDGSQLSNLPSGSSNKIYNGNSYANIATADGNLVVNINGNSWTFGNDGELTTPQGGRLGVAGKGWTGLDGGNGAPVSVTSYYANGFYAGCFSAYPDGNVAITTYTGNGVAGSWQFDNTGNLTLPAGGTISDFDGGDPNSTGTSINGVDYAQLYWNGDPGNSNPYTGGNLFTWAYVDKNGFNVQYNDLANSINNDWNFNKTGNLTVPGNIVFRSSNASIFTANTFGNIGNVGNLIGFVNGVDLDNFTNYLALDQNGNVHIGKNTGNSTGAIIFDGGYSQIWESEFGGLVLQPSFDPFVGIGNVTIATLRANSYAYLQVIGDANVTGDLGADVITSNGVYSTTVSAAGNITGAFYFGDGGYLSNINGANITNGYGNSNVATFLADFGGNSISTSGNIIAANIGYPGFSGRVYASEINGSTIGNAETQFVGDGITSGIFFLFKVLLLLEQKLVL
jgi:hypothetical protein